MPEFLLCLSEYIRYLVQGFPGVYLTCRIVRIVEHYALDFRDEQLPQSFCVRIKSQLFICRHHNGIGSPVARPVAVFHEIRSKYNEFIARIKDALIYHVDGVSCSA